MEKFDPIDIFFIKMIALYFITLGFLIIAAIVALIRSKSKKYQSEELDKPIIDEQPTIILPAIRYEDVNKKAIEKQKKGFKLSNLAIIRKLFMKEVNKEPTNIKLELKKKSVEVKEVITNIAEVEKSNIIKDTTIKEEAKEVKEIKEIKKSKTDTIKTEVTKPTSIKDKLDMPKMKTSNTKNKTRANKTKPSSKNNKNKPTSYKKKGINKQSIKNSVVESPKTSPNTIPKTTSKKNNTTNKPTNQTTKNKTNTVKSKTPAKNSSKTLNQANQKPKTKPTTSKANNTKSKSKTSTPKKQSGTKKTATKSQKISNQKSTN